MSGGNDKQNKQSFDDNFAYSADEENASERQSEDSKASEKSPKKLSDSPYESGFVASSGESSDISGQLTVSEEYKDETKGSKLNDFVGYMSSKISPKKRRHGESSYQLLEDKSHLPKEKESESSETDPPTSRKSGFMKKVQAGMKAMGDLIPSKSKEMLIDTAGSKSASPTVKKKSPLNLLKRSKKHGATKKDRMKMVQELSDSSEAEASEITQVSIIPDSDKSLFQDDIHSEDDVESIE